MSGEELKACPFCGGDVSFHKDEECPGCHLIQCGQCRAFFDFATGADPGNDCASVDALRAAIVPMWNARSQPAQLSDTHEPYPHDHPLHKAVFMARESYTGGETFEDGVRGLLSAEDVRRACHDAIEVFAEQPDAEQCREVAEYMREVLLALIARRTALAASTGQEVES